MLPGQRQARGIGSGIERGNVFDLQGAALDHRSAAKAGDGHRAAQAERRGELTIMRRNNFLAFFAQEDEGIGSAAKASGGADNSVQNRLKVGWRLRNSVRRMSAVAVCCASAACSSSAFSLVTADFGFSALRPARLTLADRLVALWRWRALFSLLLARGHFPCPRVQRARLDNRNVRVQTADAVRRPGM